MNTYSAIRSGVTGRGLPAAGGEPARPIAVATARGRIAPLNGRARGPRESGKSGEEPGLRRGTAGVVGRSAAMTSVLNAVAIVAGTDATVLVSGETGTGKELVARALHDGSARRDRPLITVNCAALPRELIESELFGHERGAFTNACDRRIGRFEAAHGGTLFLDEIGEMPPEAQVKLLRVLQEHTLERVGGNEPIALDVRVIAATNRNLAKMVAEGSFRADLFYRLNVFPIHVPPLRERAGDIPLLAQHFLQRFAARLGKRAERFSRETMRRFESWTWPGNVRELENVVERIVIMSAPGAVEVELAGALSGATLPAGSGGRREPACDGSLEEVVRQHIARVLNQCGGIIEGTGGAAAVLGLKPSTLRYRIKQLGVARGGPQPFATRLAAASGE